jgi:hypothetical protein
MSSREPYYVYFYYTYKLAVIVLDSLTNAYSSYQRTILDFVVHYYSLHSSLFLKLLYNTCCGLFIIFKAHSQSFFHYELFLICYSS